MAYSRALTKECDFFQDRLLQYITDPEKAATMSKMFDNLIRESYNEGQDVGYIKGDTAGYKEAQSEFMRDSDAYHEMGH
jgi:hypothetical protein